MTAFPFSAVFVSSAGSHPDEGAGPNTLLAGVGCWQMEFKIKAGCRCSGCGRREAARERRWDENGHLSYYEPCWGDRCELFPRFDAKLAGRELGIVPRNSRLITVGVTWDAPMSVSLDLSGSLF
jgi:hypothetical protein